MAKKDHQTSSIQRPSRTWITHSRHHNDRVHQLNVKLSGESNDILRGIASDENLRLYEVVEKVLAFYCQHHGAPENSDNP